MKRVTIHDVAAVAGVSKSTVSRILNLGEAVEPGETVAKVQAAARQLGYRRHVAAANLRRGRTGTVGVVVTRLSDGVRAMFFEEVAKACAATGRFAIAAGVEGRADSDREAVELLLRQGVDELVLTTVLEGDALPDELTTSGIPFVLALRSDGRSPCALGDDEQGGYLAARHLIDLGHRAIALIAGPVGTSTVRGRIDGYRRAMREAGLAVEPDYIIPATFGAEAGYDAAMQLMSLRSPPTAIFAVNDTTAIGAMSALVKLGLHVPRDVSLVGYSDLPIVRHLPVPLTTIRVPYGRIAADAIDILACASDPTADTIRISPPTLVVRESTRAEKALVFKGAGS